MRMWMGVAVAMMALAAGCDRGDLPKEISKPAPEFAASDSTTSVDLAKLRGHVVVVNFWATYCAPCVEELPSLLAMQAQLPDVKVVALSTDQDEDVYRTFLAKHHVNVTSVRDPDGKVKTLYGTLLIPESYVIDKRGLIRRKFISSQNWTSPEILTYLAKLNAEKA